MQVALMFGVVGILIWTCQVHIRICVKFNLPYIFLNELSEEVIKDT